MAITNRLVSSPFVNRLVTNPVVFRLLFTSFVTKRFASQTHLLGGDDWLFLNYGYEEDPPLGIPLDESDEPNRYSSSSITRPRRRSSSAAKGAGGQLRPRGRASYLTRTLKPASYTGLDFNPDGIEFCKEATHPARAGFRARECRRPALPRRIF